MSGENHEIEAALTALEEALEGFGATGATESQTLAQMDPLAPTKPLPPATTTTDIETTLEEPIEVLRARLGGF